MSTFRQKVQATTNWVKPDPEDLVEAPKTSRFARFRRASPDLGSPENASAPAKPRRKVPPPPVTAHRLFPVFAAIWFAALFGLGSLAISGEVLGAIVVKLGLPALVPATAPPLGFTAHLLVAFALTVVGGVLGLALGLRLRPQREVQAAEGGETPMPAAEPEALDVYKVRARDAHPDAPPRRPLVLTEAFADPLDDFAAEPEAQLLRRKPVQAEVETRGAEPALEIAPWIPEFTPGGTSAVRPLDLAALDLADMNPLANTEFADQFVPAPRVEAEPATVSIDEPDDAHTAEPHAEHEAEPEAISQPIAPAPALIAATPQMPSGFAATLPDVADATWSPVAGAPLENLGLVQLIERLALAIATRKASDAQSPEVAQPAETAPETGSEHDHESGPEPQPELVFAAGSFSMAQHSNVVDAAQDAETPAVGSARAAILRRLGAIAAGEPHAAADDTPPPFSRPAVVSASSFPTAAAAAPGPSMPFETDEALRSALATLQRMTARG